MLTLPQVLIIFAFASVAGWLFEVISRFFINKGKLVNPGFLSGPYLPLYGSAALILFLISSIEIHIIARVFLFLFVTTGVELATGLFFTNFYNIKLWDYSTNVLNYKGIICPLYSSAWVLLSLIFYFFIYPHLNTMTAVLMALPNSIFFLGLFYGLILFDMLNSFNVAFRIREFVRDFNRTHLARLRVNYWSLKADASSDVEVKKKPFFEKFFFSLNYQLQNRIFDQLMRNLARRRTSEKKADEKHGKRIRIIPASQIRRRR